MPVFVLGMHRAGTSAVTLVVHRLGLPLGRANDLMGPAPDNPEGFWESRTLADLNDDLLRVLGGTWSAPPRLPVGWQWDPRLDERRASARAIFDSVYDSTGGRDWLWKDPRNSFLLPFWANLLDVRPVVVLASRHPLEVWRSLEARNGLSKALSLALWERYTRAALDHARGLPAFVVPYAGLLEDPARWTEDLRGFLERCGVRGLTQPGDGRSCEGLKPSLRHASFAFEDLLSDPDVSRAQLETYRTLEDAAGPHDSFEPPPLAEESAFTEPLLAERRRGDLFELGRRELAANRSKAVSYVRSLEQELAEEREKAHAQLQTAEERAAMLSRNRVAEIAAARSETAGVHAQVLALRAEVLRLRNRPGIKTTLDSWATWGWRILGAKLPRPLHGRHERIGGAAARLVRRWGWRRGLQVTGLELGPPAPRLQLADLAFDISPPRRSVDRSPSMSIVIPVHGRVDLTEECLRAVRETTDDREVEVIVVDNASTDATAALLERTRAEMRNLTVLNNRTNVGFGPACNRGAAIAAGELIVFLNNDTRPLPGWLAALGGRVRGNERIGAAGARLIYPDARLQEAGSIIWQDGSGWNFGRGDSPSRPAYERAREVDYCSAACLMVRAELFRRLGGFDDAFAPAYYEDTDLCFRIRNAGYAVVYEPGAVVVHEEGGTSGTDGAKGFKAYQERNRKVFIERWQRVLEHQWPPNPEFLPLAAQRRPSMLVVVPHVPMEDFASGDLRLQRILDLLAQRFSVTMFAHDFHVGYDGSDRGDRHIVRQKRIGIDVVLRQERSLEEELRRRSYEFVWLEFYTSAHEYIDVVQRVSPSSTVVVDSVDVHFARQDRGAEMLGEVESSADRQLLKRTELAAYVRADLVLAVTEADRGVIETELPRVPTAVVPNVHTVCRSVDSAQGARDRVLFIGGFRHPPTVDAVLYFVGEIWPRVRARRTDLRFSILGSLVPPEILALQTDGVEVVGRVPDTTPYYERALVAVAPLRYGAGMKGKIGEAFSLGVPVVTTSIGAEGMGLEDGVHARIVDHAGPFADAVVEICEDRALAHRLQENASRLIDERWSPDKVNHLLLVALARAWAHHNLGREHVVPIGPPSRV